MRLVMMGTGTFAEPTFQALLACKHEVVGLLTQPDRHVGELRGSTRQTGRGLKSLASDKQIPVFQPESINTPEGVAGLQGLKPDLLVVAAYGQILSRDVLAVPPQGGINVHASLLPRYRGAAPVAWAIYHGETRTGVTIIRMSVHFDAGEMLAQESVDIGPEETAGELETRLALLGSQLVLGVVEQVAAGTAHGIKQDKSLVTKAPKLTKEHGLIDWQRAAPDVCNQIRAMLPWPTAYTYLHQRGKTPLRIIVHKASARPNADASLPAGQITVTPQPDARLYVAAGQGGLVEIAEFQPAAKRRMTVADFLHGHRIQSGDRFGPETG
jgi:methionyl-tRNA formyltransferase